MLQNTLKHPIKLHNFFEFYNRNRAQNTERREEILIYLTSIGS